MLGDLGAEVVKVEDPHPGDYLRDISPGMYAALNRGKRSITLDLKTPDGAAKLRALWARADVLLEGFRPGVLERLGFADLLTEPRGVVCRISGFGQTGPWRDRAGHDITYLALSGVLARNGLQDPPVLPGVQLADLFGGAQQAVIAILAALYERKATGKGRVLDVAMTEGAMQLILPHLGALQAGEPRQRRGDDILSGSKPAYRVYACAGGGAYALGALEPKFWQRFCAAMKAPQWEDRAFDTSLTPELDALFSTRTREQWDQLLRPFDCCGEQVIEPWELKDHPLLAARDLFIEGLPRSLPALSPTAELPRGAAPARGQDSEAVLRDWLGATP